MIMEVDKNGRIVKYIDNKGNEYKSYQEYAYAVYWWATWSPVVLSVIAITISLIVLLSK